ncbi:hypothetical protein TTHERM_00584490 (macronuclear) [Tetrahymena thermophila SB210]|uniref:Uncharacterized protein n=1 Tax=Tetrahymena thermophila (strain SB210) TaxID=312017 RepID=I7MCT4_TETTS|nr:hypothetical protein TTHERM_00584490 [Tetrahymena thermophila SB210]EAR84893.2 hypothetical protein TTHERM_00584490 [Tetrahymena thermophila SB210]|eukprot:XP_001032556.2 hypothetical protein TTHERM_00584490 [Tetrahymena thermophila SB210]
MNKKAINYDNNQRWEAKKAERLKKPYKQTQKSRQRSAEMAEKYSQNPKKLILGLARVKHSKSPDQDLENKPGWNDRTVVQRDQYKEKLESRFIRSDYGKENPPKKHKSESSQKLKLIHQSQQQLQKLKEVVNTENMVKGAEISKKSQLEIQNLKAQMDKDSKNFQEYNQYLDEKYQKLEEQKNLNKFLQEQVKIIRTHKKDLSKAQALQGNNKSRSLSQHSQERNNKSLSKERQAISSETWSQKLTDMKNKAENNQQKLQFRNNFFQQEDLELQEQDKSGLDLYPRRENNYDNRILHSRNRSQESYSNISRPQRRNFVDHSQESDHYDKLLEINQQEAWRQYEIHESIKQMKREKLVDKQNYNAVEKALSNLDERIEPIKIQSEQQKRNAVFSGNLIGRATTKLIKVHHQKIIELLIDDLLLEMVGILTVEESKNQNHSEKITRECLVNDYLEEFREMAYEQCEIVDRMKEQKTTKQEFLNLRHTTPHEYKAFIANPTIIQFENIQVELSLGVIVNVLEKRSEFLRKTQKLDHYTKKNMNAFASITEKLLDDILLDLAKELDETNSQYAELMFQHEFK